MMSQVLCGHWAGLCRLNVSGQEDLGSKEAASGLTRLDPQKPFPQAPQWLTHSFPTGDPKSFSQSSRVSHFLLRTPQPVLRG